MDRPELPRILVAGIGNVFSTDDGVGCEAARRLSALDWPDGVRVVDYGIRGLHLAYDLLEPWDALVLVDAVPDHGAVGQVVVLEIGADVVAGGPGVDAHGMDPATVLATLTALGGRLPPTTVLVGCRVADTGEGMGLTEPVAAAVDELVRAVRTVVGRVPRPAEVV
ncbi:MAG: hydrogenase maturation protease [Blastococcus sp.]